jgi:hypothetical protein
MSNHARAVMRLPLLALTLALAACSPAACPDIDAIDADALTRANGLLGEPDLQPQPGEIWFE